MKKILVITITLMMLLSSTFSVSADVGDNPNSFWGYVSCGDEGNFWVWKPDEHALPAFSIPEKDGKPGQVGIMVSLYIIPDNGDPNQLIWKLSPNHVFKDTIWCTWEDHGLNLGGDIRILGR